MELRRVGFEVPLVKFAEVRVEFGRDCGKRQTGLYEQRPSQLEWTSRLACHLPTTAEYCAGLSRHVTDSAPFN